MKYFVLFVFLLCSVVSADTIDSTSFEEPDTSANQYTDTGDAAVDHELVNNADQPLVNYASIGGEMGFVAYYTNTRDGGGLTDGDFFGVTNYTGAVGSYADGTQGYQLSDCDGMVTVTFDEVDLTGYETTEVSLQYFVQETGWETSDSIRIWVVVDGGVEIDLLSTGGSDIDDLSIEDVWISVGQDLSEYTTAILKILLDSNAGNEALFIDDVKFEGFTSSAITNPMANNVISDFQLRQNFPNPFNPATRITVDIAEANTQVELTVFNILGKKVATLYNGTAPQGQLVVQWNAKDLTGKLMPSGIYFTTVKAGQFTQTIKMMLMK